MEMTPHDEQLYYILSSSGLPMAVCNQLFKQVKTHIAIVYTPKPIEEVLNG